MQGMCMRAEQRKHNVPVKNQVPCDTYSRSITLGLEDQQTILITMQEMSGMSQEWNVRNFRNVRNARNFNYSTARRSANNAQKTTTFLS